MFDKLLFAGIYKNITMFPTHETTYQKLKHISTGSASVAANSFKISAEFAVNKS